MTLAFANAADFLPVTASDDAYAILEGLTREQTAAIQEFNTETAIDNSKGPGLAQPVRKIRLKLYDKQKALQAHSETLKADIEMLKAVLAAAEARADRAARLLG